MKKLLWKLLLFLPLLLLVAGINYVGDPAHIFNSKPYLKGVVDILKQGGNVMGLENYDERLLQKAFIPQMERKREVGVLGTSRAMGIGTEEWGNEDIYNSAVSSAILNDLAAIVQLYDANNRLPDTMIILAEYQYVNSNYRDDRWMSLLSEYNQMIGKLELKGHKASAFTKWKFGVQKGKALFDNKLFWKSISPSSQGYEATTSTFSDQSIKLSSGTLRYGKGHQSRGIEDINFRARAYIHNEWNLYDRFSQPHPEMVTLFESLVTYLQEKGVVVVFFISPLHPIVFDEINTRNRYDILGQTETYFQKFAQKKHIEVLGSYNPSEWQFSANDFYDGLHLKPQAIKAILQTRKTRQ